MKATTIKILLQAVVADTIFFLVYIMTMIMVNRVPAFPEALLVISLLLVHLILTVGCLWIVPQEGQETGRQGVPFDAMGVDPWNMQEALMSASGQDLPEYPVLSPGGLLYAALLMEELAETLRGVERAVTGAPYEGSQEKSAAIMIQVLLHNNAQALHGASVQLRGLLQDIKTAVPISMEEAVEILDGTTDVMVVNAGFALAMGLPGAPAYEEVGLSNLSKADPLTGRIAKDPSGKWIKGPDYFKPDLEKVLREHVPAYDAI